MIDPYDSHVEKYIFQHKTEGLEINAVVSDVFTDKIIEHFVDFLKGCGHYESCIYENLRELSDQYFELEEKRKEKERQPQPVLD